MNIDVADIKRKATARTKGLMAVHVLGNCAPMDEVMAFAKDRAWIVIEDTCESLGSKWKTRALGTLGDFGTYSFFFSHHMTTGEGGMVVCKSHEDADLLRCLRAHGWTRELSNKAAVEAKYAHIDPRFLFVNIGYNLRPMEIQAALGMRQLAKLPQMNQNRMQNWKNLLEALESHTKWRGQFIFPRAPEGAEAIWFGFPALLADSFQGSLRDYLEGLSKRGVENRPIVSGNFARQPGLALFNLQTDWQTLVGAEKIHRLGFFIGLHTQALDCEQIRDLANRMIE
jgi:CDP-6-deoxy-D-xylo-4-hexulose-3-dehydrase